MVLPELHHEWSGVAPGGAPHLVTERIDDFGWSEERAVTTPVADMMAKICSKLSKSAGKGM
jgi:hypothetical protein